MYAWIEKKSTNFVSINLYGGHFRFTSIFNERYEKTSENRTYVQKVILSYFHDFYTPLNFSLRFILQSHLLRGKKSVTYFFPPLKDISCLQLHHKMHELCNPKQSMGISFAKHYVQLMGCTLLKWRSGSIELTLILTPLPRSCIFDACMGYGAIDRKVESIN